MRTYFLITFVAFWLSGLPTEYLIGGNFLLLHIVLVRKNQAVPFIHVNHGSDILHHDSEFV